jgi:hypothetical protein
MSDDDKRVTDVPILPSKADADPMDEASHEVRGNRPPGAAGGETTDGRSKKSPLKGPADAAHPSPQQVTGAGPAFARHSKDA